MFAHASTCRPRCWRALALLISSAPARVAAVASRGTERRHGHGLIIGTFPDKFWIIDEATKKIVGSIPYESGIPRRTTMSKDGTRFYTVEAQMEKVEVVDIASRKTIDKFSAERRKQARPHPQPDAGPAASLRHHGDQGGDEADRSVRDRPARARAVRPGVAQDHESDSVAEGRGAGERQHPVLTRRLADVPVQRSGRADLRDEHLHADRQVGAVQADRGWRGTAELWLDRCDNDEPGFYTGIFTMQDPVQNRRVMGIGRVNLAAKRWISTRSVRPRRSGSR